MLEKKKFAEAMNAEGYARKQHRGGREVFLRFLNDNRTAAVRFELSSKSAGRLLKRYADKPFPCCEYLLRRCLAEGGVIYKITPRVDLKKKTV